MARKYIGNCEFEDRCEPIPSKNEWGTDVLTRRVQGRADKLRQYLNALRQGDTFSEYQGFYLQTWSPDENPVFPTVTLVYKGLLNGIPNPRNSSSKSERSGTVTATQGGEERTYDFLYITSNVTERKITNSESAPAFTASVPAPSITQSAYTVTSSGTRRGGSPPGSSISIRASLVGQNKEPIFGTPYWEWETTYAGIITS